ncbi:hypothetical protein [Aquibacillus rhizosphaerae]|uniref:Prolipoprotein diacylglyceryl transferase n=1 Tax=Aquibacillus rhizosphaerae TaxID=3051431 RepID=A0ABT7L1E3_9BACI|nr:hypothetical protein [Aquibacillus sp. LR5S19]MDL4839673.1 hypothetical protein [Aquibacillus sp. LR5S19]
MPSAWLIGPLVIKSELVVLIGSFLLGIVFFRFVSPYSNLETKKWIDGLVNLFIVFVISLWIGKIITNLSIFINDPLPILAYPSDSKAFYVAVALSIVYGKFKLAKEYHQVIDVLFAWLIVFFTASFVYGFVQMIFGAAAFSWQYLGLHVLLLILFVLQQDKLSKENLVFTGLLSWSIGQWLLALFSRTTVFQFNLSHWFYAVVLIVSVIITIYGKKVKQ